MSFLTSANLNQISQGLLSNSNFRSKICTIARGCIDGGDTPGVVSSVGVSIPTGAISVSGSPITSSGTFAFTYTGTSTQLIAGDGSLVDPTIATLQTVTTGAGNNIISNTIQVSGSDNIDFGTSSIILAYAEDKGSLTGFGTEFPSVTLNTANGELSFATGQGSEVLVLNKITAPTDLLAEFGGRVSGSEGTESNDFITYNQVVNTLLNNVIVSTVLPTANIVKNSVYTYTGTDATSWDLPTVVTNTGSRIVIINAGIGILTINSFSGTNDIYSGGIAINTIAVSSGEIIILYNNSINWVSII